MVSRRQFLKHLGLGMAVSAVGLPITASPIFDSRSQNSAEKALKVAFLADSHLPDGNHATSAAKNLIDAVAEINHQNPPVDLVFLAGDLSDNGDSAALCLGREILASLKAPCWLMSGEQDCLSVPGPLWKAIFRDNNFSFGHQGVHFCGLNTNVFNPATGKIHFQVSDQHYRWLATELASVPLEVPLIILSHAPLYRVFQPWQWWTEDTESLYDLFKPRKNVYLLHGHVHQNIILYHRNLTFQGLRATAWPLPDVRVGCNDAQPNPTGIGKQAGCGWMLLTIKDNGTMTIKDQVWGI
jgi:Icc protein